MRIAIYSPYLDSFGGGERYILTIGEILSPIHKIELLIDNHLSAIDTQSLKSDLESQLNLDLSRVSLIKAPLGKKGSFFKRLAFLRRYDIIFYLTDGSIFFSTAKKGIIHFQVPFINKSPNNLWERVKLSTWDEAIYNSNFTRKYLEKDWSIKGRVVYPPVDIKSIKPLKKKKQIVSVGRFFGYLRSKKQEVMIQAFADLYNLGRIKNWSLHLAGAARGGDETYLKELKQLAKNLPIEFYPNLAFDKLVTLYGESSIYWHAAGFGETNPERFEHFGITTVEAMAGGCVPVVINSGGQPEIVEDDKSGFLWNDIDELKEKTLSLISNPLKLKNMSNVAIFRSSLFSKEKFAKAILNIANDK